MDILLFSICLLATATGIGYFLLNFFFPSLFAPKVHCHICGKDGKGKKVLAGSAGVELLMWIFFLLPGVLYSLWRHSAKSYQCPHCQAVQGVEKIAA
jgi:hypothetical protein